MDLGGYFLLVQADRTNYLPFYPSEQLGGVWVLLFGFLVVFSFVLFFSTDSFGGNKFTCQLVVWPIWLIHRKKKNIFKLRYIQQLHILVLVFPSSLKCIDQHPGHLNQGPVPDTPLEEDWSTSLHCFSQFGYKEQKLVSGSLSKGGAIAKTMDYFMKLKMYT